MNAKALSIKGNKGFSLIEILLVMVILSILLSMVMVSTNMIRSERLRASTQTLLADLQKIRTDAMTTGASAAYPSLRGSGIRLANSTSYVLFKFNDTNPNAGDADFKYDGTGEEAAPITQTVNSSEQITVNPVGTNVIIFDRFGFPRKTDWTMLSTATIILSYQNVNVTRCISIEINSIREGLWNGTSCSKM